MKYKTFLDKKKRLLFKKNELKRISIKVNNRLNTKLKINHFIKLFNLPLISAFSRIKNRCFISDRSKSIYKKLKVSRIKFRELVLAGAYSGFTKTSW
jgi:ribosomal protein S14